MKFNKASREVKRLIREAHRSYEMDIAEKSKSDPKILYAYVNGQNAKKDHVRLLIEPSGKHLTDGDEIVECLNGQYAEQFNRLDKSPFPPTFNSRSVESYSIDPKKAFSPSNVKRILQDLNSAKAMGLDGIHPHVLKECRETICLPISLIFINSFESGKLPDKWKRANITPIFKKGTRTLPQNYRPVSLLSVISKIMEKLITGEITSHLARKNLAPSARLH